MPPEYSEIAVPRENVFLECTKCGNRNYRTSNKTGPGSVKLNMKKFCKFCKQHTEHKEKKK